MSDNITYLFEQNNFTDLTLYQFGFEKCAPALSCGPAKHNHYLFHYILNGTGIFCAEGINHTVHQGEVFLIFPNKVSVYQSDISDPWTYIWIEFDGLQAERYLTDAGFNSITPIYKPVSDEVSVELKELFQSLLDHNRNDLKLIGTLYFILETMIRTSKNKRPPKNNTLQEFYVHEALMYIDRHYREPITVAQLADWCNINRSYFGKIFRNTILTTPQKYLIRYRMNIACGLLRDTDLPIAEIAEEVGYENQMNFSRVFHKEMGMAPREYKRRVRLGMDTGSRNSQMN